MNFHTSILLLFPLLLSTNSFTRANVETVNQSKTLAPTAQVQSPRTETHYGPAFWKTIANSTNHSTVNLMTLASGSAEGWRKGRRRRQLPRRSAGQLSWGVIMPPPKANRLIPVHPANGRHASLHRRWPTWCTHHRRLQPETSCSPVDRWLHLLTNHP